MFDLSALDAELDGLGRAPENVTSLARTFAGVTLSGDLQARLAEVDAELSKLADDATQPDDALSRLAEANALSRLSGANLPSGIVRVDEAERELARSAPPAPFEPEPTPSAPPAPFEPEHAQAAASEPAPFSSAPPPAAPLTESQEIVLPDPIAREELSHESGELSLSDTDPSSGSFELPDAPTEPRIVTETDTPAAAAPSALMPFDDVQDALEGSQPIAIGAARAMLGPNAELDRDPDAEFDALLSEATDPRGIPTLGGSSEYDTDDLLRGLEGELTDEDGTLADGSEEAPHEADMLTRSLYDDSAEHTDVLDRETLGAIEGQAKSAQEGSDDEVALSPDELDSGELELMVDDEPTLAPQPMPPVMRGSAAPPPPKPARPSLGNKAPPPPPPSGAPERRPSGGLFGRLFTKREGE